MAIKSLSIVLIPLISVFLAVIDGWLVALEGGLVNPLQALALILWNACASHQEPASSELRLGITTIGCQFIPLSTPVKRGVA